MTPENEQWLNSLPHPLQVHIQHACRINPRGFRNILGEKDWRRAHWAITIWIPFRSHDDTDYFTGEITVAWADGDTLDEATEQVRKALDERDWRADYARELQAIEDWIARERGTPNDPA